MSNAAGIVGVKRLDALSFADVPSVSCHKGVPEV